MNNANEILSVKNVIFKVPNREKPIVNQVDFTVAAGDFAVLLGSNGSGKSSLIKLVNRSYRPNAGNISLLHKAITHYSNKDLVQIITTLTQNSRDNLFLDMSIAENAMLYELRHQPFFDGRNKVTRLQELQQYLTPFSHKLAQCLNTPVDLLSGGEQQILILALCLRHPPKLLLLDEHTSALDPKTAEAMMEKTYEAVTRLNITCIMTTHNLAFATRYGNRLIALKDGGIIQTLSSEQKANLTEKMLMDICY